MGINIYLHFFSWLFRSFSVFALRHYELYLSIRCMRTSLCSFSFMSSLFCSIRVSSPLSRLCMKCFGAFFRLFYSIHVKSRYKKKTTTSNCKQGYARYIACRCALYMGKLDGWLHFICMSKHSVIRSFFPHSKRAKKTFLRFATSSNGICYFVMHSARQSQTRRKRTNQIKRQTFVAVGKAD